MTKGRATTLEERVEIVTYSIEQGKNYGAAIERYQVSYQQIYSWVNKYKQFGVCGLEDKRGKRKKPEEMTEVERLRAENRLLQAENRRKERLGRSRNVAKHVAHETLSDNAPMERYWGILKCEMYYLNHFEDYDSLAAAIEEYIHFYNYERRQRRLDCLTPMSYRQFLENVA